MQSFSIARRVVERLKLTEDEEFIKKQGVPGFFSRIRAFAKRILKGEKTEQPEGSAAADGTAIARTASDDNSIPPAEMAAIATVQAGLRISRVNATFFIDISFSHRNPKVAARIANAVAEAYLYEQLEARYQASKRATSWLSERVATLRSQVEASERSVAEHRAKYNLVSPAAGTLSDQQAAEINTQLISAHSEVVQKRARYEQAKGILEGGKIESVAEVMQSPAIAGLRAEEAKVAREEADLLTRYGPAHPDVQKVRAQRSDFRRQIAAEVSRVVSTLKTDFEFAQQKEASLSKSLQELTGGGQGNEQAVIKLRDLERQAQANKALYETMLTRSKEAEQQANLQTAESRIVMPAFEPGDPSYPDKRRMLIMALLGGLGLGFAVAFLLEYIENGFTTIEELEKALQLPVLAILPRLTEKERQIEGRGAVSIAEFVAERPLAQFSESVRSVRVSTLMSNVDSPPRVVLITSSVPSEGKSTLTSCLAYSAAAAGQKTLVIDCDFRHPSFSERFGLSSGPGLTDLLTGEASAEQVLQAGPVPNLSVIPAGTMARHPPDILRSEKMSALLNGLRPVYDLILIDSPPVTPVIDSTILSKLADKVVMVVQWRSTPRDIVIRAVRGLDEGKKVAGVVLNNVQPAVLSSYSSAYTYYHKRYHQYYSQ
jgi:exopolysaccharide transport family protein